MAGIPLHYIILYFKIKHSACNTAFSAFYTMPGHGLIVPLIVKKQKDFRFTGNPGL